MRINNKKLKNRKKLLLDFVSNKEYQPMRAKDIAMLLQIPKGKRSELFQVLDELEAEGKIICKKGKYEKVRKIATVKTGSPELSEGTFVAHPKGFGFGHKDHGDSVYGTGNRIEYEILSDVKRTLLQLSCKGVFCTQREVISNDYIYNGRPFVTAKTVNSYKC